MRLPLRLPLLGLVLASVTLAASAFAEPKKPAPAAHPPKHAALGKKHASKVAKLTEKGALKKAEAVKKADPKKVEAPQKEELKKADVAAKKDEPGKKSEPAKKDEIKKDDPPEELTGHLAQAKIADKKKKTDGKDADKNEKKDKKILLPHSPSGKPHKSSGLEFQNLQKKLPIAEKDGKKGTKIKACLHPAVSFARLGQPTDVTFALTTCAGGTAPGAVDALSILARPYDVAAPTAMTQPTSVLSLPKKNAKPSKALASDVEEVAPGIRRIDPGMVTRLQAISDKFPGKTITLVSGYRPASKGSPHQSARAFDIRIDGVTNESLVAFCKTMHDTGCGYYPNSYFVHVDVRKEGVGHVFWIDTSGPGEKPNYVKQWPPPLPAVKADPKGDLKGEKTEDPTAGQPATTDTKEIGPLEDADDEAPSMTAPTN